MIDQWPTAERLRAYYDALAGSEKIFGEGDRRMGRLEVLHAIDDFDISFHQTEMICQRMFSGRDVRCIDGSKGADVLEVREERRVGVRFEILERGGECLTKGGLFWRWPSVLIVFYFTGHNRIVTYTPVAAAVLRASEDLDRT